ncbi:MAG: TonB-dependent receptor [Methylophilaceae bacterium]|nr:TonB-dependent receptor [Methylophilaceae bacterium]
MSNTLVTLPQSRKKNQQLPFRVTAIVAALGAVTGMMTVNPLYAADNVSVTDLQAEITNLKQALEQSQRELANEKAAKAGVITPAAAVPNEAAPIVAAEAEKDKTNQSLDAVVIRSTRSKLSTLKDIPTSASVVTGKELDRELALDIGSITRRSAGIQFNQNNTRGASLSIRGLGKRSFNETQDPSVNLEVDGVSYGLAQLGNFDFHDVDSVEVSRGPSGTAGGFAASAGRVVIRSKRPSFDPSADFQLTYGQRDTLVAKATMGGTVIEDLLAWRGSIITDRGRGFYASDYDPNYSFYNHNRFSGRMQFLLTPIENLTARFSFDLDPKAPQVENGLTFRHSMPFKYANGSLTDPNGNNTQNFGQSRLAGYTKANGDTVSPRDQFVGRTFSSNGKESGVYTYADYISQRLLQNENQGQTVTNKGASADISYNLDDKILSSVTAWRNYSFDAHNDEGTPFDINKNGGGGVVFRQYTQEFKIESDTTANPGKLLDYKAGVFVMQTENDIASKTGFGADAGAWFATNTAGSTIGQYDRLYRLATGADKGAGQALMSDSLNDVYTKANTRVDSFSTALFGQINWHVTDEINLLTGLRISNEDRSTTDSRRLVANGVGAALNPVAVRGVATGGFSSNNTTGDLTGTNSAAQLALADAVAAKYFGAANYAALTADQKKQVGSAKALRAQQIGTLSNNVTSNYQDVLFTSLLSPSYKFDEDLTVYASWQFGQKSGSALNINYKNSNVKPETTNAYELGFKSTWFNKELTLNADIYYMDIDDYQTTIRAVDDFTTQSNITNGVANPLAYTTVQGNVKRVDVKGLEVDAFYSGIPYTTVRFGGAYTDARYRDFKNAVKPDELTYLSGTFIDQSGQSIPGISKWTFNLGAEFRRPWGTKTFHTSFNTNFNSKFNNSDTNSSYGIINGYTRTDVSAGIEFNKGKFDLSLIGKNVLDNRSIEDGWVSKTPYANPHWWGIMFNGKL